MKAAIQLIYWVRMTLVEIFFLALFMVRAFLFCRFHYCHFILHFRNESWLARRLLWWSIRYINCSFSLTSCWLSQTCFLTIVVVSILEPSLTNATLAIAVVSIPSYVRLTRAAVLNEKNRDYVTSSRVAGASVLRLMFIVILPNCLAPLIVQMTMGISNAILELATLGFLGIGAKPPTPELGTMLSESRSFMQAANWLVTIPGLVILSLVLAFNLMGDGLRDALDPKLKQ